MAWSCAIGLEHTAVLEYAILLEGQAGEAWE
jgi:hypothetical protein